MFLLEMATLLLGIGFIAAGTIQSRKTGQKKWHIFTAAGIVPVLISVFLFICTIWLLYGIQIREQETEPYFETDIAGDDWRTFRAYSEDLHLDDAGTLIFCLSPLDGKNGYAVYDSASGAREGSLLWEPEKEADDMSEIQLKDLDNDGTKEIGISMTDGQVLWYHYREELKGTWPENKGGCFEKTD